MEIGALSRPMGGETQNGDGYFIAAIKSHSGSDVVTLSSLEVKFPMSSIQTLDTRDWELILIAVIDGVGHGPQAAGITQKLIDHLNANFTKDLEELIRECHRSVRHTRGAALGLALIEEAKSLVEFIGVGNVRMQVGQLDSDSGRAGSKIHEFISNKGILGYNLPARLASFTHEYLPGDALVMFTDGIEDRFSLGLLSAKKGQAPSELIKAVFADFGKRTDDATMVLAK